VEERTKRRGRRENSNILVCGWRVLDLSWTHYDCNWTWARRARELVEVPYARKSNKLS